MTFVVDGVGLGLDGTPIPVAKKKLNPGVLPPCWFSVKALADGETLNVSIYDEIGGWGVTAKDFKETLDIYPQAKVINLSINSPGGSVFEGLAIITALEGHPARVIARVDGVAASMASAIAVSADELIVPADSYLMIHSPRSISAGEAKDHRKNAELLDKVEKTLAGIYQRKCWLAVERIEEMMTAETWLTGREAVELGLADKLLEPIKQAEGFNSAMLDKFESIPDGVKRLTGHCSDRVESRQNPEIAEILKQNATLRAIDDQVVILRQAFPDAVAAVEQRGEINNANTPDEVYTMVINEFNKDREGPSAAQVHVGNGNIVREGLSDAVAFRAGLASLKDKGNPFQAASLLDMARASLVQNGVGVAALGPMQIIGAAFTHSTGDFGSALADVAEKAMLLGWQGSGETFPIWTRKGSVSSFHPAHRVGMSGYPALPKVAEGAEYTYATVSDRGEVIALATYGSLFTITRQAIINDDLSLFNRLPAAQGRAAMRTIGNLVYSCLTSNSVMSDGKGIFHADHGGNTSTDALDITGISNARKTMRMQTDEDGQPLGIAPGFLLVPAALESQAQQVIASTSVPGTGSNSGIRNPVTSAAEIVVESRLDTADADTWYMVAGAGDTIEVAYLNGVEQPYLEQQAGFTADGVAFKVRIDAGVAPMDWRGFVRGTGGLPE